MSGDNVWWSPCALNSRVVRWVTWLNSPQNEDFLYKMIAFDSKWSWKRGISEWKLTLTSKNRAFFWKELSFWVSWITWLTSQIKNLKLYFQKRPYFWKQVSVFTQKFLSPNFILGKKQSFYVKSPHFEVSWVTWLISQLENSKHMVTTCECCPPA